MSSPEFVPLVRQHQKIIHKVCHLYADRPEDREDLFQEILLNAWKAFSTFRSEARFSTWLYQIALNVAISYFRKEKKKPVIHPIDDGLVLPDLSDEDTAHQFQAMYKAIGELNRVDKAIIMLYFDQYDYRTIGNMLGLSDNNVAVRMNRIKTFLKTAVTKYL